MSSIDHGRRRSRRRSNRSRRAALSSAAASSRFASSAPSAAAEHHLELAGAPIAGSTCTTARLSPNSSRTAPCTTSIAIAARAAPSASAAAAACAAARAAARSRPGRRRGAAHLALVDRPRGFGGELAVSAARGGGDTSATKELTSGCNDAAASDRRWREVALHLERAGIVLRNLE